MEHNIYKKINYLVQRLIHKLIKKIFFNLQYQYLFNKYKFFIQFFSKLISHKYLLYCKKFSESNN
jgi:hypothetical protein